MYIMYTREAKILFGVWNAQANKVKIVEIITPAFRHQEHLNNTICQYYYNIAHYKSIWH